MTAQENFIKKRTLVKLATMALAVLPRKDIGFARLPDVQNAAGTLKEILDNCIGVRKRGFHPSRYSRE